MAAGTPQSPLQRRVEGLIGAFAPLLDLVLAAGERVSRAIEGDEDSYYPVRSGGRVPLPGEEGFDGSLPEEPLPAELLPRRADADHA